MKSFFKDWWELTKLSGEWMKKHWKGYMVLIAIITVLSLLPDILMFIESVDFKSVTVFGKKIFSKKEEEDM